MVKKPTNVHKCLRISYICVCVGVCVYVYVYVYIYIYIHIHIYIYTHTYIQGVTGGKDQTSGGCSLC